MEAEIVFTDLRQCQVEVEIRACDCTMIEQLSSEKEMEAYTLLKDL